MLRVFAGIAEFGERLMKSRSGAYISDDDDDDDGVVAPCRGGEGSSTEWT